MAELIEQVQELEGVVLSSLPAPLQASSASVEYGVGTDLKGINHMDSFIFDQSPAFSEELKEIAKLDETIAKGEEFVALIYAYRSCSKALPVVGTDADDATKKILYTKSFEILSVEIGKIRSLMVYHKEALKVLIHELNLIVKPSQRKEVINPELLTRVLRLIDIITTLDLLKDVKTCLRNDFVNYKRAFQNVAQYLDNTDSLISDIESIQMFVSNMKMSHNVMVSIMKSEVHKVSGYEDALAELADFAMSCIADERLYLLPAEHYMFYRVIIYLVFLSDGLDEQENSVFRSKKMKIDKIQALYRNRPVIPVYLDTQLSTESVLLRCVHYDPERMAAKWIRNDVTTERLYDLTLYRSDIRKEHNSFMSRFAFLLNDVKAKSRLIDDSPMSIQTCNQAFILFLEGLQLVAKWHMMVEFSFAWKRSFPITDEAFFAAGGTAGPAQEYAKITRYSFGEGGLYALCDIISMIKAVGALLVENELHLGPLVRRYIYHDVQTFCQQVLTEPMRKALKRKRDVLNIMIAMRDLAADWGDKEVDREDFKVKKKDAVDPTSKQYLERTVGLSDTQIKLLRQMALSVFSDRALGMQSTVFVVDKNDLKKEWADEWKGFYDQSFFYPYVLNFSTSVAAVTDLSFLWYREFYLEITKCVQFPLEMSMPWVMTEFLVEAPSVAENLFYPLDVYNDVATFALKTLKQKYMYDEIEAETNLVFEQLVDLIANSVFTYFKSLASNIMVEKNYKAFVELKRIANLSAIPAKYSHILSQRFISLLGRKIDLQALLLEQLNNFFKTNVEYAIARFESQNICYITELELMLEHIQITHRLLSQHIPLDSYDMIFTQVNQEASYGNFSGRIAIHAYSELVGDLFPNYVLNTATMRFTVGSESFADPHHRHRAPKVASKFWYTSRYNKNFDNYIKLTTGFFGDSQMMSLLKVLGKQDSSSLFDEVCSAQEYKVNYVLSAYVTAIVEGLDPMKHPSVKFGVIGGYGYYDLKLKPIAGYAMLRSSVFQTLREVGNSIAFLQMWGSAETKDDVFTFQTSSYFNGVTPGEALNQKRESIAETKNLFEVPSERPFVEMLTYAARYAAHVSQDPDFESQINEMVKLTEECMPVSSSVSDSRLTYALTRLDKSLRDSSVYDEWITQPYEKAILDVETPLDFCRFWSAVSYIFLQKSADDLAGETACDWELFGDGFFWAGATLLYLTGHRDRLEYTDFVYYVMSLQEITEESLEIDPRLKKKGKLPADQEMFPLIQSLLNDGQEMKNLTEYVFSILGSHIDPHPKKNYRFHPVTLSARKSQSMKMMQINATPLAELQPKLPIPAMDSPAPALPTPLMFSPPQPEPVLASEEQFAPEQYAEPAPEALEDDDEYYEYYDDYEEDIPVDLSQVGAPPIPSTGPVENARPLPPLPMDLSQIQAPPIPSTLPVETSRPLPPIPMDLSQVQAPPVPTKLPFAAPPGPPIGSPPALPPLPPMMAAPSTPPVSPLPPPFDPATAVARPPAFDPTMLPTFFPPPPTMPPSEPEEEE